VYAGWKQYFRGMGHVNACCITLLVNVDIYAADACRLESEANVLGAGEPQLPTPPVRPTRWRINPIPIRRERQSHAQAIPDSG
jgi:hypothetical protein